MVEMETFRPFSKFFQHQLRLLGVVESTQNDFQQKMGRFVFDFEYSAIFGRRVSLVMYNVRVGRESI